MNFRLFAALSALLALPLPLAFAQVPPAPLPTPAPTIAPTPLPGAQPTPVQNPKKDDTPGEIAKGAAPKEGATPQPTPDPDPDATPKPKTIEDLTKGFEKSEGVFTIYRKLDGNKQRFLAEIKESQIGPLFLLQSTFASGNAGRAVAGRPADDTVWRFERTPDDRLVVAAPNIWYRATDPNLKIAVQRDFPEAYLDVFPILAKNAERKSVLIDFGSFFDGGIPGLDRAFSGGPLAALIGAYALDPQLSFVERLRNFPTNLVVESLFHFQRVGDTGGSQTQADVRSLPIRVVFNLYPLQNGDYRPRLADPRVGFFINGQLSANRTGFESFDDEPSKDPRVIYINRWNLKKADPAARLSPPVRPIVFFLDRSVPARYRQFMREGILSWNTAFQAIGIVGAIEVRDAPTGENAEYDHADMRFNTLRWVASPPSEGGAYAIALLRENPLTGEIINASITVNANFARIAYREKNQVVDPLSAHLSHGAACELSGAALDNAARGADIAQRVDPRFSDQKYVDNLLRALVAHEFGHILGLRHNFVGSTFLTPAQLSDAKTVRANSVSASVMDYVGFNVFGLKTGADLFARGPGKYDRWAIEYGYKTVVAASPQGEKTALNAIAARNGESGLVYYGDELADDYDPTNVRYDLSSDPLAYAQKSLGITRYLLQTLGQREPKNGESYAYFTRRFRNLIRATAADADIIGRYIGGARVRRVVKGDKTPLPPFSSVPLAQQRRALQLLQTQILAPNVYNIPPQYLNKTAPDPFSMDDTSADSAFPLRDEIGRVRSAVLTDLFEPSRLNRIANSSFKFGKNTLALSELFAGVRAGIWGDLAPKTAYSAQQRDLANTHLAILVALATSEARGANADARLLAQGDLQALKTKLGAVAKASPDQLTRLFAADALRKIDAAFKKKTD